jgi:hypothetical protein
MLASALEQRSCRTNGSVVGTSMPRIAIIDEISVTGSDVGIIRQRYLDDYAPGARARGMSLELDLQWPASPVLEGENRLTFVWSVTDLQQWWQMRLSGAADPSVLDFWAALSPDIIGRRRSFQAIANDA